MISISTSLSFSLSLFLALSLLIFSSFLTSQLMSVGGGDAIRDGRYETKRPSIRGKYGTALLTTHFVLIFPNRDFLRLPIRQPFRSPEVTSRGLFPLWIYSDLLIHFLFFAKLFFLISLIFLVWFSRDGTGRWYCLCDI